MTGDEVAFLIAEADEDQRAAISTLTGRDVPSRTGYPTTPEERIEAARGIAGDEFVDRWVAAGGMEVATKIPLGTRWRLRRNVERYPHFVAKAGMSGVVTLAEHGEVYLKMAEPLLDDPEWDEWDNSIHWYDDYEKLPGASDPLSATESFLLDCEQELPPDNKWRTMEQIAQYRLAVDTTDEPASRASAEGLGLDYKVLPQRDQWPEVQVTGTKEQILDFLIDHQGDSLETPAEYFAEHAEQL